MAYIPTEDRRYSSSYRVETADRNVFFIQTNQSTKLILLTVGSPTASTLSWVCTAPFCLTEDD